MVVSCQKHLARTNDEPECLCVYAHRVFVCYAFVLPMWKRRYERRQRSSGGKKSRTKTETAAIKLAS